MSAIAILGRDEHLLERITDALMMAGYDTVARLIRPSTTVGELVLFVARHDAMLILFDLRQQLEESSRLLQQLWAHRELPKVPFVLTTRTAPVSQIPYRYGLTVAILPDGSETNAVVSAVETCSRRPR